VELPTIEIVEPPDWEPADAALERLGSYAMAIFTSVNGVERFLERLVQRGGDLGPLRAMRLVAIGPATAAALTARGLEVAIVPKAYRAEGVLEAIDAAADVRDSRVLLPRAMEAREVLPEGLRAMGARVDVVPVYRTRLPDVDRGTAERLLHGIDMITFTSSSTVRNFVRLVGEDRAVGILAGAAVGCIGPITGETARDSGLRVDVQPEDYTVEAFHDAIVDFFRAAPRPLRGT
jgi:uroporphyrinogen III methyltransferase/synthase